MTDTIRKVLRNVIGGGKSLCPTLFLLLTLFLTAACTDDSPASPEAENTANTRSVADSTAVGDTTASVTVEADTTWSATYSYDYDGNLIIDTDAPADGDVDEAL